MKLIQVFIIIILILLVIIRHNRQSMYFRLKNNSIDDSMPQINIGNHHAVYYKYNYYKYNNENCLLISHGNSSNIYNTKELINKIKKLYKGDIFCYEYPGFGKCKGRVSIKGSVDEHLFWLDYLSKKYNIIDLWGYSIGGGVVSQTIKYIPDNISNKIRKVYFHNTFSCIKNIVMRFSIFSYILYKILFVNDFNTNIELKNKFFKNKEIIILHSINDDVVPYNEAIINYNLCKILGYNIKLIDLEGGHTNFEIEDI